MFGAPAITCMPARFAACAAAMVTGNSLMRMPSAAFSAISSTVRSSWLASARVRRRDALQQGAPVGAAQPFALSLQLADAAFDVGIVEPAAAPHGAVEIKVGVLPDAGAVVHQADHAHARMVGDRIEQFQHVVRRHLAAQVQEVLSLQQIRAAPAHRDRPRPP